MKKVKLIIGLLTITGFSMLTSCNKTTDAPEESTFSAQDDALAEQVYTEVSNLADEAYDLNTGGLKSTDGGERLFLGECASITLDTTIFPRVLTIDFGEENCLCNDGRYRRGKIIISFTGRYRMPGTVITHGFDNYYVDDNKIEGTKVVTNMGQNDSGHTYFTIEVVGIIYKANDGGTISWNSSRVREWAEGEDTRFRRDDVYLITGTANGIRANGETWEKEIINALRVELNCRFIVSGTMEIRPENRPLRILDYGDGECDNIATVLIDGVTYTIRLH
jgi:hypothetical protein